MDLLNLSAREVGQMISVENDKEVLGYLIDLEDAILSEDELGKVEAVGHLSDLLVLHRGMGM